MTSTPASRVSLVSDLRALGVRPGDVLMVHVSLRRVGPIDGGADALIDALLEAVGGHGTLLVNTGVRDDWSWVNERPPSERAALLQGAVPFDPLVTPSDPDNGVFAEVFRKRAGTLVSNHPEGRFAARGRQADRLVGDVPWDDYYGPGSPLERFVELDGRVLRLGADEDTITLIHFAEYLVELAGKPHVCRHRLVLDEGGVPVVREVRCLDDSDGIGALAAGDSDEDYFALILRAYLAEGRGRVGVVGSARSELLEGADLMRFSVEWMAANLRPFPLSSEAR